MNTSIEVKNQFIYKEEYIEQKLKLSGNKIL